MVFIPPASGARSGRIYAIFVVRAQIPLETSFSYMPFVEHQYYVYLMTDRSKTIYTGMTNGLRKRVIQHKLGINEGFTKRYKIDRLVYWENYQYVRDAIAREKEIKSWLRVKKIQLIVSMNPAWKDLALELWPELEAEIRQIRKILDAEKRSKAGDQVKLSGQSGKKRNA